MAIKQISKSRDGLLGQIKNELQQIDTAIEIGTWRGDYAVQMIEVLKPKHFYAVDPYRIFPGMVSAPGNEYDQQPTLDALAEKVVARLNEHGASLIRDISRNASTQFVDNSVDIVYIDGDHTYEGVKTDINSWWPKIKPGCILCGDDYVNSKTGKGFQYGVIQAVQEFVEEYNLELHVYTQGQKQWLVRKPHV